MTSTAEFELELLKEKNSVIRRCYDLKGEILNEVTYIDKHKILDYLGQIDMIIFSLEKEYEEVRAWKKKSPSA